MKFNLESTIHLKYKQCNDKFSKSHFGDSKIPIEASQQTFTNKQENGTHFELSHSESLFLLRKIILSTQEGESRLRSFVRIRWHIILYDHVHNCTSYLLCFST